MNNWLCIRSKAPAVSTYLPDEAPDEALQKPEMQTPESIVDDYPYLSSRSNRWLVSTKTYVYDVIERVELNKNSQIVKIAS